MSSQKRGGPLQGVRVLELTKVWAGPAVGKLLAFLGAEVIRVESEGSLDVTRTYGVSDINNAPGFQSVNAQKLSVQVNMKSAEGVAIIHDLLRKTDIVVENLRPGAVKRLGLGYEQVRASNPNIIYVSMGMYGSEGPLSYQTGYAPCFAALGGLSSMVGYAAGAPVGMNTRYGDSTFGTAAAYGAMVALLHRRRTGVGQFVDVSAVECMSSMAGDALMDFALNGNIAEGDGSRHADMAPHGTFPCRNSEWLSIAVSSDAQWAALATAMGQAELAAHASFCNHATRKAHEDELEQLIATWTTTQDAATLANTLQQNGVCATKSQSSLDMIADPLMWGREFYQQVTDAGGESKTTLGPSWRMSRAASITQSAPRLGEHNAYVLGELLGLSEEEQQKLAAAGIAR